MSLTIWHVDAFTTVPFAGNPAAVCFLPAPGDDHWMQNVAQEMNLSETAFLVRQPDGFSLRWFTPAVEVDLCGHATLASAHVLWQEGFLLPDEPARFHTRSGLLTANRQGPWIEMDFPAEPAPPAEPPIAMLRALDVRPRFVGRSRFDYLIEVDSEDTVRSLRPDMGLLTASTDRGVIVTSRAASPNYDFVSRFFAPAVGVPEDPVTGSAHCTLAPFWRERLSKDEMLGFQASARGGVVRVRPAGSRVILAGQAVTVIRGTLF